jgi:hypothetical protein
MSRDAQRPSAEGAIPAESPDCYRPARDTFEVILPLTLALLILGPLVFAGLDVVRTPESELREIGQAGWLAIVVFIPILGPVAWLISGRPQGGRKRLAPAGNSVTEDDEAFMRHISAWAEFERTRYETERRRQAREADSAGEPPAAAA